MAAHKQNRELSFRDLESFNKAFLAKQLWRILTQPISLVATILQEKYCHVEKIMSIKVTGCQSLLWKSLMATWDLVRQGMRWRVGNGEKIHI